MTIICEENANCSNLNKCLIKQTFIYCANANCRNCVGFTRYIKRNWFRKRQLPNQLQWSILLQQLLSFSYSTSSIVVSFFCWMKHFLYCANRNSYGFSEQNCDGENEAFGEGLSSSCDIPTCKNKDAWNKPNRPCTMDAVQACICVNDTFRHPNGSCVPAEECP